MKILSKILLSIYTAFYAVELSLSIVLVVILMPIFPKSQRRIRRVWGRIQRFFLCYKLEIIGKPEDDTGLFIMNHQSMLDIIVFEEIFEKDICWLAKKEIADMPVFGRIMDVPKMIAVDRKNPRAIVQIVKQAKEKAALGRPMMIFPEGTRSRTGKLLRFKKGAKIIAEKTGVKVQPIVICNALNILDSKKFIARPFKKLTLVFLNQVDTSDENWLENTREKMQETLYKYGENK